MNASETAETMASETGPTSGRIVSVDALRGFDMFWIVGGSGFMVALFKLFHPNVQEIILPQLDHAQWEGFTFYDLIFPLFVFLVGMSTVFSLRKLIEREGKWAAHKRLFRRSILLLLMGILYYGGLLNKWPEIRLLGVLQRIALCYFFTGLVFIHFRLRGMIITCLALLVGYWALLSFVPVPGLGEVSFAEGKNWANYVDQHYLIGKRWDGDWDPEGLLSTLPAIGSCLIGVFAALLIKHDSIDAQKKVLYLLGGGVAGVIIGYLWGLQFPVIKKIWTSSYVLVSGGYSCVLLGIFYQIIDIWKFKKWTPFFVWTGTNAITIYMARNIINFNRLAGRFVGGDVLMLLGDEYGHLLQALFSLGLTLLLVRFLYKKGIFLRF